MKTTSTRSVTQRIFPALGTVNTLTCFDGCGAEAMDETVIRIKQLHSMLSAFDKNSEISRINRNAGIAPVQVSDETMHLIIKSIEYSELTGGRFDITTGPLSRLWKRAVAGGSEPDEQEIESALELTGYRDILADERKKTVMLRKKGQSIDLGAIAKGYAADEAKGIFQEHGISDAIINLGGTVIALGEKRIGIQHPFRKTGAYFGSIKAKDEAVVTAGVYEQCRKTDGGLIHHIIDPKTGYPAAAEFSSVTLTGDSAEELDALSTAALMTGAGKAAVLLAERGIEGLFVTLEGEIYATRGISPDTDPEPEAR